MNLLLFFGLKWFGFGAFMWITISLLVGFALLSLLLIPSTEGGSLIDFAINIIMLVVLFIIGFPIFTTMWIFLGLHLFFTFLLWGLAALGGGATVGVPATVNTLYLIGDIIGILLTYCLL